MSENSYKMIELVGSSHTSIEAAVQNAIAKAEQDESKLRWFEVVETRGHIEDGKIAHGAGKASKYTRSRLPVTSAYSESQKSKSAALKREAAIKRLRRSDKDRLLALRR